MLTNVVGHRRAYTTLYPSIISYLTLQMCHNVLSITFAYLLCCYSYQSCGWRRSFCGSARWNTVAFGWTDGWVDGSMEGCLHGWKNGSVDGRVDGWKGCLNGRMDGWVGEWTDGWWMNERVAEWMGEWMCGWVYGRMVEWMDDWVHGWLSVCVVCLLVVDLLGLWRGVRPVSLSAGWPLAWIYLP